jgi:hypothetical protein
MSNSGRKKDDIHRTPDVSYIQNEDVSHEESDVDVKAIASFIVGLFLLIGVSLILMRLLLNFYEQQTVAYENAHPVSKLAAQEIGRLPPVPRLQEAPGWSVDLGNGDVIDLTINAKQFPGPDAERRILVDYWRKQLEGGHVDPKTGFTTIPIEEAMRQTLAQDVQATSAPPEPTYGAYGQNLPSDSNSGRVVEKKDN